MNELPDDETTLNRRVCLRVIARLMGRCDNGQPLPSSSSPRQTAVTNDEKGRMVEPITLQRSLQRLRSSQRASEESPICIEIRSSPINTYGNALRHYYARVENLLDVHPGTNHRLALAWWHNSTVLPSDVLERELTVCGMCCDRLLAELWRSSERFHLMVQNCDIMLNRGRQTFAMTLMGVTVAWYAMLNDAFGTILLLAGLMACLWLCACTNKWYRYSDRDLGAPYCCEHVEAARH